jgi:hypothetical protein
VCGRAHGSSAGIRKQWVPRGEGPPTRLALKGQGQPGMLEGSSVGRRQQSNLGPALATQAQTDVINMGDCQRGAAPYPLRHQAGLPSGPALPAASWIS